MCIISDKTDTSKGPSVKTLSSFLAVPNILDSSGNQGQGMNWTMLEIWEGNGPISPKP